MMKQIILIGVIIFSLFIHSSCKREVVKDKWTDTSKSGVIEIACDEDFKALMETEVNSFNAHNPDAFVLPIYTTEKEAIRLLVQDSVRLALVTRDLYPEERDSLAARTMFAKKFIVAFDGITLIMNKQNSDSIMSVPVLQKILTGEITEWSQIYPDSKYGAIRTLFSGKESGTLRYLIDSLLVGNTLSPNIYAIGNNEEVLQKVAEMPNGIGVVGANVLSDDARLYKKYKDNIRMMRISVDENPTIENSYLPYAGDIVEEDYPLWRPVYVLLTDPRSGLSASLCVFISHEIGQKIILKSGLLPVTSPEIMKVYIKDEYPY
ncbi:phosphate transport system substrate-binding protein [Dysgonomonadaceae bacterium PH5-43]|nr:phosphate transport system substrate-binding protein [Dysgonomonadaceae bacterium PH5-43]